MEQFKASYRRSSRGQLLQTITGWRKTDKDRPIHGLTSSRQLVSGHLVSYQWPNR